jgi:hypothetical protein
LSQTRKRYPIADSPFYKLRGKGQLARLLALDLQDLQAVISERSYRVWTNDKGRVIQAPMGKLEAVHGRIARLLARIELPDYVYSRKGRSHVENGAKHVGPVPLIKTDISRFYPSTTRAMVVRIFRDQFGCAEDVAHILGDICCYQQAHLPTGSALSGFVAFLAAKPMFDSIDALARERGCRMSSFVDDITISGDAADLSLLLEVRRLVRKAGLKTKATKSRVYAANRPKAVTGTIVTTTGLLLPNRQHLRIWRTRAEIALARSEQRPMLRARLKGQLIAAHQVSCAAVRANEFLSAG